jgi:hypothetical protein
MNFNKKILNDYFLGVLYGDGYKQEDCYFFSTTHKYLANQLEEKFISKNIHYARFTREYHNEYQKDWELLEIFEIYDKDFIAWLDSRKMFSDLSSDRIKCNSNFVRGFLETKGTLFYYKQRGTDAWRISFSGLKSDLQYLYNYLINEQGINCSAITQRKEREEQNIVSNSYRFSIQNRTGIDRFLNWIDSDIDVTPFLKEKIESFKDWNRTKPFNQKTKVYKNYRRATLYMANALKIELSGIRGGGRKIKPIYLWEEGKQIQEFEGWQGAYEWTKEKYENETGMIPPTVAL